MREDEKKNLFFIAVEDSSDGIMVIDRKSGKILFANPSAAQLLGRDREKLIGLPFGFPTERSSSEMSLLSESGDTVVVEMQMANSSWNDTDVLVVNFRNITLRKETEQLHLLAKKAAEEANRAKSEFLANMSHELRSPLNSILVLSQLMAEDDSGTLPPDKLQSAEIIHHSGTVLLILINDLLDLSKIEAGRLTLCEDVLDLDSFVRELEQQYDPLFKEKGLSFSIRFDMEGNTRVFTDELRLGQILRNFLSNSLKFTHRGEICLHIFRPGPETKLQRNDLTPEQALAFAVSDTGIGIAPDNLTKIFDSFTQADASTTRNYGGTGLGLTIALRLAHLFNGEIQVESEEGQGSKFTLFVPFKPVEDQVSDPVLFVERRSIRRDAYPRGRNYHEMEDIKPRIVAPSPQEREVLSGKKVLIIDADMRHVFTLMSALSGKTGEVLAASGGVKEGLGKLREHPDIALVLMEMELPDLDGCQAIREVCKNIDPSSDVKILVVTARAMRGDMEACLKAGAHDYVSKPYDLNQLISKMARLLDPMP